MNLDTQETLTLKNHWLLHLSITIFCSVVELLQFVVAP